MKYELLTFKNDYLALILTLVWVLIFLFSSEYLARKEKISKETARKVIHISVGNVVFFLPLYNTKLLAVSVPFVFIFGNFLLSPLSPIEKIRMRTFEAGHAWGTILYPISLTIITFFSFEDPSIIMISFLPLVYGDGFAAVIGQRFKSKEFSIYKGATKSLLGTLAMALFSIIAVFLALLYMSESQLFAIFIAIIVGLLATILELFSPKGMDNLVVPLSLFILVKILGL